MSIDQHPLYKGDLKQSARESLEKYKSETDQKLNQFRLPDQELLADVSARLGRPLAHNEFIDKVQKMTRYKLWAEESLIYSGGFNFYRLQGDKKVCCNSPFLKGFLPEFTVIHEDHERLPGSRTPGWREVLRRLIEQKIVTYGQVDKWFGKPSPTNLPLWDRFSRNYK